MDISLNEMGQQMQRQRREQSLNLEFIPASAHRFPVNVHLENHFIKLTAAENKFPDASLSTLFSKMNHYFLCLGLTILSPQLCDFAFVTQIAGISRERFQDIYAWEGDSSYGGVSSEKPPNHQGALLCPFKNWRGS